MEILPRFKIQYPMKNQSEVKNSFYKTKLRLINF